MTFHDAVMTFQFFQLAALLLFIAFAIPVAPLTNEPKTLNSSRIGKISSYFAGNIRFFVGFFFFIFMLLSIRFDFHSRPNSYDSSSLSKSLS